MYLDVMCNVCDVVMCKKIYNSVIEGDGDVASPLGPARGKIDSPRFRRTSVRVRESI